MQASAAEQMAAVLTPLVTMVDQLASKMAQLQVSQAQEGGSSGGSGQHSRQPTYKPKEIPVFKGEPRELRPWMVKAQQWLARYPASSDHAGMLGDHLEGPPFQRYVQMCREAHEPVTAEQVFAMLERHFADPTEVSRVIYQFQHLRQGSMTVMELSNKLDELAWTPGCEDLRTELLLRERFLSALNPEIAQLLTRDRLSFRTKEEAVLQAVLQERNLQASKRYAERKGGSQPQPQQQQRRQPRPQGGQGRYSRSVKVAAMAFLEEAGVDESVLAAVRAKTPLTKPPGAPVVAGRSGKVEETNQCWNCQQWGHRQRDCPTQKPGNG